MTCQVCNKNMSEVKGCNNHIYLLNDDTKVEPIRVGDHGDWYFGEASKTRCSDCGSTVGYNHHTGCDVERCRICNGQFITCDCDYSEEILIEKLEEK